MMTQRVWKKPTRVFFMRWMVMWVVMSACVYASHCVPLDTIDFQVTKKQWVHTKTALLTVYLNATLNDADVVKARSDILNQLSNIATGEWHITQFDRSQDNSGLEKLSVRAEARVLQPNLTHVYGKAKSVSKPGANYSVGSIDFQPSLEEVQQVRAALREELYQQAQQELIRINNIYKNQQYTLNQLIFLEGSELPVEPPKVQGMMTAMAVRSMAPAALTVSQSLTMTAWVQAASNRQQTALPTCS